jgi:hypothetical protein
MSEPKEVIGALYFSEHEPCIIGKMQIGATHYDLSGVRRSNFLVELTGRRITRKTPIPQRNMDATERAQMDMFDENSSTSGDRKQNLP